MALCVGLWGQRQYENRYVPYSLFEGDYRDYIPSIDGDEFSFISLLMKNIFFIITEKQVLRHLHKALLEFAFDWKPISLFTKTL